MDRKRIAAKVREDSYLEDEFLLKYDNESVWMLIDASLPKNKAEKIKVMLNEILADTKRHKMMLGEIAERLEGRQ